MSTVDDEISTQYDDHSGRELSGILTPSTGTFRSHKLPEADFEKGPPVENEKRKRYVQKIKNNRRQQLILWVPSRS